MTAEQKAVPDPVGAAIAAAEAPEIVMRRLNIKMGSSGRPAIVFMPRDVSDAELADIAGMLLTQVMGIVRAERARAAGPQLVIARSPLRRT